MFVRRHHHPREIGGRASLPLTRAHVGASLRVARDAHFPPGTAIARARARGRARGRQRSTDVPRVFSCFRVRLWGKGNTYTNRDDLKAAVDACLIDDATSSCDMNSWDVSAVASMHSVFRFKAAFDADRICLGERAGRRTVDKCFGRAAAFNVDIVWVEHQLCDNHGKHVSRGDIVQRRHQWVGHPL